MNPWKDVEDENLRMHTITITDDLLRITEREKKSMVDGYWYAMFSENPTAKYNWDRLKSLYKEIKRRRIRDEKAKQND